MLTAALATTGSTPLTLFDRLALRSLGPEAHERIITWSYRIGIYLMMNVLDEPAWLAFMFC